MKEQIIWEVTVGRATRETLLIGADDIDSAIDMGVAWLKDAHPQWMSVDRHDVLAVEITSQWVLLKDPGEQAPSSASEEA